MAKKPSKSDRARTVEAARPVATPMKPREQVQQGLVDRIQPALKLSELNKASRPTKAISAQQKMAERVRASLQLPHLEALTKQAAEAAGVEHGSALPSARTERPSDIPSSVAIASVRDLGQLIREAREQRKLSQQAFADLVGVGRRFISELENGKATLEFDKVLQVASATGIDLLARRRR
jgi:HTH-type transcriptional regulator/antitoxin HipB